MKKLKIKCLDCRQEISRNNISKHQNSKTCLANQKGIKPIIKLQNEWEQSNGKYRCPYCDKEYTKKGIATHIWRTHGDGKDWTGNTDAIKNSGESIWNKGLTAETDERVKKSVETLKERYRNGELTGYNLGTHLTDGMKKAYKKGLAIGWSRRKILEQDPMKANEKSNFYIGLFEYKDYKFVKIGTAKKGFKNRYNAPMYKKYKNNIIN